jgi:peptidyl-prolyl cis-trans isomerase A (cyclophilin A)
MRNCIFILPAFLVLVLLSGCKGKPHPELFSPEGTKVWPTVDEAAPDGAEPSLRKVEFVTNMGRIVLELFEDEAPLSVANFIEYVESGYYDGTIFHRVEPGLVVQGGGFTAEMERKPTNPPIANEAGNGLRNMRGTLGMARTMEMNSANSQFYVNLVDNAGFNGDGITGGYAVFGRVYEGMSVIDAMALVEVTSRNGMNNVPVEPIEVLSATVLE